MEHELKISDRLVKALMHDDDLVAVVRSHIEMELLVNEFIEAFLPFPDRVSLSRFGWPRRIELALACGLKKEHASPLRKLGEIRNRFAHQRDAEINTSDVEKLVSSMKEEAQTVIRANFEMAKENGNFLEIAAFDNLPAKDKFVLVVVHLYGMLKVAIYKKHQADSQ